MIVYFPTDLITCTGYIHKMGGGYNVEVIYIIYDK